MKKKQHKKQRFRKLDQTDIAEVHGVTSRTIREWGEQGLPRNPDGSYDGPATIEWRIARSTGGALDLDQERARLAKEQADKTALENAQRRGELVDLNTIGEELGRALAAFRARLLGAANKLAPRVNPEDPARAQQIIAAELEQVLTDLSNYRPGETERTE